MSASYLVRINAIDNATEMLRKYEGFMAVYTIETDTETGEVVVTIDDDVQTWPVEDAQLAYQWLAGQICDDGD